MCGLTQEGEKVSGQYEREKMTKCRLTFEVLFTSCVLFSYSLMQLEAVRVALSQNEMFWHRAASMCMAVVDVQALAVHLDCNRSWLKRTIGLVAKDHGLPKSAILREGVEYSGPESLRRRYLLAEKLPQLLRTLGRDSDEIRSICRAICEQTPSAEHRYDVDAAAALQSGLRALEAEI